ncbi:hypothetical protein CR513_57442, partial [Mucuna pruriens]
MSKKKGRSRWKNHSRKFTKEVKDKSQMVCYKYEKFGHFKYECPNLEKEKEREKEKTFFRKKKDLMATCEDLDLSSFEEEDKEENICLMANTASEGEVDDEEKENESLKEEKAKDLSTVNTLEVHKQLQEEVIDLKQSLILKHKRHSYDKSGIGYDKKKDLKKDKFGHLSYCCKNHPKGSFKQSRTNKKIPNRIWLPKNMIVLIVDLLDSRKETPIMILGQWLLTSHDKKKVYVPRTWAQVRRISNQKSTIVGIDKINKHHFSSIDNVLFIKGLKHNMLKTWTCKLEVNLKAKKVYPRNKGKQVSVSFESKNVVLTSRPLVLLHIDLFGPTRAFVSGKHYGLVMSSLYFVKYFKVKNELTILLLEVIIWENLKMKTFKSSSLKNMVSFIIFPIQEHFEKMKL